jgi:uncharacterized protein involved in exopolysaccharide biosynthesis
VGVTQEEKSLLGFINILLKYRRTLAVFAILGGLAGVAAFFSDRQTYTARAAFTVGRARTPIQLVNPWLRRTEALDIAGDARQSAAYYVELLVSRPVLRAAASGNFTVLTPRGRETGPLARFYGIRGRPDVALSKSVEELRQHISISSSQQTGTVWFYVDTPYPEISAQLANALMRQLEQYNLAHRQVQATAERAFIENRLDDAATDLHTAENQLAVFRERNLIYRYSPQLLLASDRLQREVRMRQQLYDALMKSYEQARIEEVRDLPTITILEPAVVPTSPVKGSSGRKPLLGAITGLLIGIILGFIRERVAETRAAETPAFVAYAALKRQALRDLAHPLDPIGRFFKARTSG